MDGESTESAVSVPAGPFAPQDDGGSAPAASSAAAPPATPPGGVASPASSSAASSPAAAGGTAGTPATAAPKPENFGQKMIHGILNALGGSTDVAYSRDAETGKLIATHVKSGPGSQWKKIIAGGLTGAAAGAAQSGPGAKGRAAAAGFNAGFQQRVGVDQQKRQQADQDFEAGNKVSTRNAEIAWHNQQIAESSWRMAREKTQFGMEIAQTSANMESLLSDPANEDLGTYPSFSDFLKTHEANFHDLTLAHAQGEIRAIPVTGVDKDGNPQMQGVHLVRVDKAWADRRITEATQVDFPGMGKDGKLAHNYQTIPAGGATNNDVVTYQQNAAAKWLDYQDKTSQIKERNAQAAKAGNESALASEQLHQLQAAGTLPQDSELAGMNRGERMSAVLNKAPANIRETLRGVATYKVDPKTFSAILRKGTGQMDRQTALNIVRLANPNWTEEKYQQAQKLYNEYASARPGTRGGNVLAFNTGIAHLAQLKDAGEALAQHDVTALNSVANTVGAQIGQDPKVVYQNIVNVLSPEIAKATKGNVTDTDVKQIQTGLGSNQSPAQRRGTHRALAQLMVSKLGQQQAEDTAVLGEPLDMKYMSDESSRKLQTIMEQPVMQNGKLIGYTTDGKTMRPAQ